MSGFLAALGLALILEGLFPFISPGGWREAMKRMRSLQDGQLRVAGLLALLGGCLLVVLSR
jgi:uncharacterized protein YjeT (DUF2065 family)